MTIKELRKRTGLSQSKFAERFSLNLRTLQSWESNDYRQAPRLVINLISEILDMQDMKGEENVQEKN